MMHIFVLAIFCVHFNWEWAPHWNPLTLKQCTMHLSQDSVRLCHSHWYFVDPLFVLLWTNSLCCAGFGPFMMIFHRLVHFPNKHLYVDAVAPVQLISFYFFFFFSIFTIHHYSSYHFRQNNVLSKPKTKKKKEIQKLSLKAPKRPKQPDSTLLDWALAHNKCRMALCSVCSCSWISSFSVVNVRNVGNLFIEIAPRLKNKRKKTMSKIF